MLSVSFVILWFVNRGVLVHVQISNRVSLQLIPEEPLSYDNFLKVCEEKQTERVGHFKKQRSSSRKFTDESKMEVRVSHALLLLSHQNDVVEYIPRTLD